MVPAESTLTLTPSALARLRSTASAVGERQILPKQQSKPFSLFVLKIALRLTHHNVLHQARDCIYLQHYQALPA